MGSRGDVAIERMLENLRALCEPDLQPITISAETEAEKA
jgi:hypothetical protein